MNRFHYTKDSVARGIQYLKDKKGVKSLFLERYKGNVKKGKLYLDNKLVIPDNEVEKYLRDEILKGEKVPLSRDAAYYYLTKQVVNVSRQKIEDFLKKQRIIRETDNQQPTQKKGSRSVKKKGQLHYDLIEIKFKDLKFQPQDIDEIKGYIFSMTDALTSLSYFEYGARKTIKIMTPIAKRAFEYFKKQLGIPYKKMIGYSDKGSEFDWKEYNELGIKTIQLSRSSIIEAKNAHFQRVLYRIAKMEGTKNIAELVSNAMEIVNNTRSSVSKKTPAENVNEKVSDLSLRYNKKRGKDSGVSSKLKPLQKGDRVRTRMLHDKDKTMYKAYKGNMWSKTVYTVQLKKAQRYKVNGTFYHRDELRITPKADQESEKVFRTRKAKFDRRYPRQYTRSKRSAAKKGEEKRRASMKKWKKFDEDQSS